MNVNEEITVEDAILEAAEKLFLEKGFALTSTTQIAEAVGCNQAMVHYYYRTKDRLFEAVFEKKIKLFVSNLLHIGEENIPFKEKLRKRIESHFDMIKANPKLPFLIYNELTTNPKRLVSLKEKIGQFPQSVIAQLEKELQEERDAVKELYTSEFAENLNDEELSTLFNFNRETYTAFKSIIFAIKDLLLNDEDAKRFDEKPGFIR